MLGHLQRKAINSGSFLIACVLLSHVINLVYSAFIGKSLSLSEFGLVSFVGTLASTISIIFSAISATVNYHTGYLTARYGKGSGSLFHNRIQRALKKPVIVISLIWLISTPFLATYFQTHSQFPIISFLPILLIGFFSAVSGGFLKGRFLFHVLGFFYVLESVIKLIVAYFFVTLKLDTLVYLALPISITAASLATLTYARQLSKNIDHADSHTHAQRFSKGFFFAAFFTGLSSTAFLTADIMLVKHFFTPEAAGIYALLALVGKMIFFFGSLFNTFIISLVSRDEGSRRDPVSTFYLVLLVTTVLTFGACGGLVFVGPHILPMVFGDNIRAIFPYLYQYSLAISLYTITTSISAFHLARKHYFFSVISFISTLALVVAIGLQHSRLEDVVGAILGISMLNSVVVGLMHLVQKNGGFLLGNILDFVDLFKPMPKANFTPFGKRILIFNWRDTRHCYAGGAEAYIHELGKRWVKDGNAVTLFCGNDGKSERYETIDGVDIIRRGGFYMVYFWALAYYIVKLRRKFDIIIDCENGIPFFTPLYAKEKKYLLIHHVHQEVFRKSLLWPLSTIASFLEIKVMPYVYQNTQFITVSPSTKAEIISHRLTKIDPIIIYNGIDRSIFKPGTKEKRPFVLYLGRLQYYKTINTFIRLARVLSEKFPKATFAIAGEGEEIHKLRLFAQRIKSPVEFLGKVSEKEKVRLLQKAWVMVNPSAMEGWGLTVIEANACGTPVVAANVPGLRDSVKDGETGFLAKHANVHDFVSHVERILTDKQLRMRLSKKAVQWSTQFNWDTSKARTLTLFNGKNPPSHRRSHQPKP